MSNDHFKQYVEENRSEFESYSHDSQEMWRHIEKGLKAEAPTFWTSWVKAAAVVLVIAVSGWMVYRVQLSNNLPTELYETEQHYYRMINIKLLQMQQHHQKVDAMIWDDLELLDLAYEDLKKDLKEQADQEEVAQAMIENQRAKLEILEQVLNEIESKANDDVEALDI